MKQLALVTAAMLLSSLSGCKTPPNPLMGPGHTPMYVEGFNDGCPSGRVSQDPVVAGYAKDTKIFNSDKQYAQGWNAGYQKCSNAQMEEDAVGGGRR